MQAHRENTRVTLSDVVLTVSRLTRDEREAAAVINHMLNSSRITFANAQLRKNPRQLLV
jgi:hypothetical protein